MNLSCPKYCIHFSFPLLPLPSRPHSRDWAVDPNQQVVRINRQLTIAKSKPAFILSVEKLVGVFVYKEAGELLEGTKGMPELTDLNAMVMNLPASTSSVDIKRIYDKEQQSCAQIKIEFTRSGSRENQFLNFVGCERSLHGFDITDRSGAQLCRT